MSDAPRVSTRTKLWVDIVLLVSFMAVSAPHATGIPLHEWLSFAFVPVFIAHLVMNWDWIARKCKMQRCWRNVIYRLRWSASFRSCRG